MEKERSNQTGIVSKNILSSTEDEEPKTDGPCLNVDKEAGSATCRVCQCLEPDRMGNIALGFLGISPPVCDLTNGKEEVKSNLKVISGNIENNSVFKRSEVVEFISPTGEVFLCTADVELGLDDSQDRLFELGCACKNDLALAHYACALKWFISHGSTVCEICGSITKNIRPEDYKRILGSLKEYESLRERTVNGEPNPATPQTNYGVDPDAVAAIRRQRLSEISLWFNPHNNNSITVSHVVSEQPSASNTVLEEVPPVENTATKWAVESTGILLATGLLTVTLAWLLAPHVGKKTAKSGLHILLGGVCALTVVVFFRFFVLTRIKYGPARYWAILFVFWFLVFGIWASRTHGSHAT
ncbi:hypothetical protein SASPL_140005 [Salvia splendens]|uniref:RING-CH-type domain-containing protein n=1 Tax=Salvia splendens TaxID=180675 RepID=A0A8X8WQ35_SALSN|nr:uncharacterized protein LOC121767171 [Salvia splendens]XP_042019312.1 uncharacterized protein LOC121767171 [Salvia splendens]XP_042019313.1 uncharacterized protein LOC121767171 [Salvia splendens]XP_042019314.1 uncharacterized protein LOC121767171 [Salvia splendens]XP_042019315.1 uncharacterized protein LOC121767171 [Salvia splendens]KAG6398540.1 hypothetical protein SASPL_140005 [Salvia splendens]